VDLPVGQFQVFMGIKHVPSPLLTKTNGQNSLGGVLFPPNLNRLRTVVKEGSSRPTRQARCP
jgi:hypothetical protein